MPDSRLLHRDPEIAALQAVVDRLLSGRPSVLLIDGPRGIGKSALLVALQDLLPAEVLLLRARCAELEQGFAFGMVEQLFDSTAEASAHRAASEHTGTGVELRRILDGLYQNTRSLAAGRPVVLLVDDIHLADEESRQWFSYIARRLHDMPVALVATVDLEAPSHRDTDVGASDMGAVNISSVNISSVSTSAIDIGADGITLHAGPLCASCTDEAAAALLGAPLDGELAAVCHLVSGGNPLILREFVGRLQRAGISPGGPDLARALRIGAGTIADTTLSWLQESDSAAMDLLAALVVLGPGTRLGTAALLAGQGGYQAQESVATLGRAGLVEDGDVPEVSSELVRSAVLEWAGGSRRLDLHRRAGELLIRLGSSPAQAADHLMLVGPSDEPWVLAALRSAAAEAAGTGQPERAVGYLRRAVGEAGAEPGRGAQRIVLESEIGVLETHLDLPAAIRCVQAIANDTLGFAERAAAMVPLASPVMVSESGSAVRPFLQLAATAVTVQAIPQEHLRLGALSLLAGHPIGLRAWTRAIAARGAGAILPDGSPVRALLSSLAAVTAASGRFRLRSLRLASRAAAGGDAGAAVIGSVLTAGWAERFDDAENWATAQVSRAEQRGHRTELALALVARADVRHRRGRPAAARADAVRAGQLAVAAGARGLAAAAAAVVAITASVQGHPDLAAEALEPVDLPPDANPLVRAMVLRARGIAALSSSTGESAGREALALFLESGHELASRGIANPACLPWRTDVAGVYLRLGETEAAATIAAEDLALARGWGSPGAVGRALAMFGAAQPAERARELLTQAVALLEPSGMVLDLAQAHRQLAAAAAGCGDPAGAADSLGRATELAGRSGVTFVGTAPGAEAGTGDGSDGQSGVRPHRAPRLTMSEARVSELVLRGLSNQQVADQLCISRRTVDTHLNRIYRKLEIRSRGELGYALKLLG